MCCLYIISIVVWTANECWRRVQMPDEENLRRLLRKGTIANAFVPVLCGSAFKNKGVQPLLDAVTAYLPSPLDVPPMKVRLCAADDITGHGGLAGSRWLMCDFQCTAGALHSIMWRYCEGFKVETLMSFGADAGV